MARQKTLWILIAASAAIIPVLILMQPGAESPDAAAPPATKDARSAPDRASAAADPIEAAFARLPDDAYDPALAADSLADLRRRLADLPPDEAVRFIRDFLRGGRDRATGLSFEIAADGSLAEWPTLRTFLLDALAAIDPAAAAALGREILSEPTTADEWALALRNVARAEDPDESRDFLRAKTEELIANPAWRDDPSIGYLNAFDVLVHTEAVESTPLLSSLVRNKDRKDLAHAAFLTLDRLVRRRPAAMLDTLADDPGLASARPEMTAQQFARADLRDTRQRELVEQWLLDPARSAAELNAFAGVFPNQNQFVSNNLLTKDAPVSGTELAAHDREVLAIVRRWQDDPAFQPVADHLTEMSARLIEFTRRKPQDPR